MQEWVRKCKAITFKEESGVEENVIVTQLLSIPSIPLKSKVELLLWVRRALHLHRQQENLGLQAVYWHPKISLSSTV